MKYFNHFADAQITPQGAWLMTKTHVAEYRIMRPYLKTTAQILEIGPGHGGLARLLRSEGFSKYVGVEPNAGMRGALAQSGFQVKDYRVPPFVEASESYDWVILMNVFEHLAGEKEATLLVQDAYRILMPEGYLCIAGPDYLHWQTDFFNCDYTHSNVMTVRRLIQQFHNCGFRTVTWAYLSGFLTGASATALSYFTRAALFWADGKGIDTKFYKLKVSLLRRFLIIGQKLQ